MSCKHKEPHTHLPLWLVKVTWLDAATYNNGWHDLDDLPIENDFFETYGVQFIEDDLCMYLTDTIRPDFCVGTIHQIPKGMIKSIVKIKKVKDTWGFEKKAIDELADIIPAKESEKKVKKGDKKG